MIIVTLPSLYLFMAGKNLLVELETAKLGRKKKKKKIYKSPKGIMHSLHSSTEEHYPPDDCRPCATLLHKNTSSTSSSHTDSL